MARPRRETKQLFYDTFCEFEVEDQARVLEFLQEFHRQKKRLKPAKVEAVADAAIVQHIFNGYAQCLKCGAHAADVLRGDTDRACPTPRQGSLLGGAATEADNGGSKQEAIDVSTLDREPGTTDMLRIPKESE